MPAERRHAGATADELPLFALTLPSGGETPVLVEVPHAGLGVPEWVEPKVAAPRASILRDADIYVDRLCSLAPSRGAALLTSHVSRYVVDLNRAPDDVDAETVPDHPSPRSVQPRGVVWRTTTDGKPALLRPMRYRELVTRVKRFHEPYHDALRAELTRLRQRYGFAILLAAHSMPSIGRSGHADHGVRRADVVPGTRGRTTAHPHVIDLVDAHFRAEGMTVRHDDPYRGGFTTGHYGRPHQAWHAIQLEINRGLYVHEDTGEPRAASFDKLQLVLASLVEKLGSLKL